jgi:hypothetical protein
MTDTIMLTNYIYLLQEREFIKTKENIYKVGRTKKENHQRFNQYPKGSILLFQMICNNCENIESLIIKQFKEQFIQRKDIGNEYFEGDYHVMINNIYLAIINYNPKEYSELLKKQTEEKKELLKQQKEEEKELLLKQQKEEKELLKQQKEEKKELLKQQKEEEKELLKQQKEEKELLKQQKEEENKNNMIKPFIDWIMYEYKNKTLKNDSIQNLYISYKKFETENKYIYTISLCKFGLLLKNENTIIPFNVGYKCRRSSNIKMRFDFESINKYFNREIHNN